MQHEAELRAKAEKRKLDEEGAQKKRKNEKKLGEDSIQQHLARLLAAGAARHPVSISPTEEQLGAASSPRTVGRPMGANK